MESKFNGPIFYLCNDPERALGLEKIIKDYHIVCIDYSTLIPIARKQGVKIFSLAEEENLINPIYRSSSKLLKKKKVQEYIKNNTKKGEKPNIIVFKISLEIEKTCKELGYNLLNTTSALNKKFELKISQYNNLPNLKSFFPKTVISPLNKASYTELKKKLSEKFVIQYNRGHTGKNTLFINDEEQYLNERKKYPNRLGRIAEFIEGDVYTMNMCVTRFGAVYGGLSYQITGVEELTSKQGGTVGNDWLYPQKLRKNCLAQIDEVANRLQETLYSSGYRGMVGLDFVINKRQRVYLIEINARQPASTSIHTKLMLNEEFIPLQAFHFAEFLFEENGKYMRFLNKYFSKGITEKNIIKYIKEQNKLAIIPIESAQITLRNTGRRRIKVLNNIEQGVYIQNQDKIFKTGKGYSIEDIIPGEYLILTTQKGQFVSPDNEIARIQALDGFVKENGILKKDIIDIIKNLKENIQITNGYTK